MFRYNGADTDWTGFEYTGTNGYHWRVIGRNREKYIPTEWLTESPSYPGKTNSIPTWLVLMFWADQAQACIDALEAQFEAHYAE